MIIFNDNEEFQPKDIDLTSLLQEENCWRLERNTAIDVAKRIALVKQYRDSIRKMLADLRSMTLKSSTRIVKLSDTDNTLIATKKIPAGTILGPYFGSFINPQSQHDSDISLTLVIRDTNRLGNEIQRKRIIGKIAGNQTNIATTNHTYRKQGIEEEYIFINPSTKNEVAFANIIRDYLCFVINKNGQSYEVSTNVFIAAVDIAEGEPLLLDYEGKHGWIAKINDFFTRTKPRDLYWGSRGKTPLLFNRQGSFLSQDKYFPKWFHLRLENQEDLVKYISIHYSFIAGLMGSNVIKQKRILQKLNSNLEELPQIQKILFNTGFINDRNLQRINLSELQTLPSYLMMMCLAILIAIFVYQLSVRIEEQRPRLSM